MGASRFQDLRVWQEARLLASAIYGATRQGAFNRDFGLRDQIERAAVSIMSNIAEGFERYTAPEFRRFLGLARGSAAEVRSQLYVALDLGYLEHATFLELENQCLRLTKMITALRNAVPDTPDHRSHPAP